MGLSGVGNGGTCVHGPPPSTAGNRAAGRSKAVGLSQMMMMMGLRSCLSRTQVRALHLVEWEATWRGQCWGLSFDFLLPSLVKHRILDPEGLALGAIIASSKKARRNLIDDSFSR